MLNRKLLILFPCLFLVMVGYGLSLAVLPFYVERLALSGRVASETVTLHVGLLPGIYALSQFALAPLWGRCSDRHGRKPVVLMSLSGFAVSQAVFGLGTSLPVLYVARVLAGVLAAGILPSVAAYWNKSGASNLKLSNDKSSRHFSRAWRRRTISNTS